MKSFNLLLIAIGLIFSVQTFAQVKFGIKAGGNVCNMKFDIESEYGDEPETKGNMGFHIGLITDISLSENTVSLQPALLFSNKGYSVDYEKMLDDAFDDQGMDMDDYEGYARMNYNYIELPINIVYKNSGFQLSAGPYVAMGLGGNFKHDFTFKVDEVRFHSDDFF